MADLNLIVDNLSALTVLEAAELVLQLFRARGCHWDFFHSLCLDFGSARTDPKGVKLSPIVFDTNLRLQWFS